MKTKKFQIIEMLCIVGLLACFYLPNLSRVEFHPDESQWIATSSVFETYLRADFESPLWDTSYWTLTQPPVVRYVIGFSRYLGGYRVADLNKPWDFDRGKNFNVRKDAMPGDGLLWWSRLPMAILAILSMSLVFSLLRKSWGRFAAYPWLLFALFDAYFLLHMRRAMGESCLLFFTVLGIYAIYCAFNSTAKGEQVGRLPAAWLWLIVAGAASGLAGASKLNGLANLGACILAASVMSIWILKTSRTEKLSFALIGSALATFACLAIFVVANPFLWPNPVDRTNSMLQNRVTEMSDQIVIHAADYIGDWSQRVHILPLRIFESYAALPFPWPVNLGLFILGLGLVGYACSLWLQRKSDNAVPAALLIGAIFAATPSLFTTIDWDRYYLFPVFFSSIFIAIVFGWLLQKGIGWLRRSRAAVPGTP